jgi:Undecaprenyl-phosphate glucose phosphotransferase
MNIISREEIFSRDRIIPALADVPPKDASEHADGLNPQAQAIAESFATKPVSPRLLSGVVRLFEAVAIGVIGLIVHAIYVAPAAGLDSVYLSSLLIVPVVSVVMFQAFGTYSVPALRSVTFQLGRLIAGWTVVFAAFALLLFFFKSSDQVSRVWFGSWYVSGLAFFAIFRPLVTARVRALTRDGRLQRRAVIVGGGQPAAELINALERQNDSDIAICGIFDDRSDDRSPAVVAGYPKLGTLSELVAFGRRARIDMLIVSLPLSAEKRLISMMKQLWVLPVDIRLSAQSNKLRFRPRSYSYVGQVPFLDVFDKPIADWDSIFKRVFDVVMTSFMLVLLSPLMLLTALAIKLDSPGPVFFRQKRYGFNNEVISVLKFRSMYHHMADPAAKVVVTRNDPRVTRVGRFIRRTSIDELPQLFNVLMGSLSLVGPRPHAVNAHTSNQPFETVVDDYFARHRVRPGVTGWAQVNGWRGEIDAPEKIRRRTECDLYYIENWSVLFDLYIVLATPFALLKSEGAY